MPASGTTSNASICSMRCGWPSAPVSAPRASSTRIKRRPKKPAAPVTRIFMCVSIQYVRRRCATKSCMMILYYVDVRGKRMCSRFTLLNPLVARGFLRRLLFLVDERAHRRGTDAFPERGVCFLNTRSRVVDVADGGVPCSDRVLRGDRFEDCAMFVADLSREIVAARFVGPRHTDRRVDELTDVFEQRRVQRIAGCARNCHMESEILIDAVALILRCHVDRGERALDVGELRARTA